MRTKVGFDQAIHFIFKQSDFLRDHRRSFRKGPSLFFPNFIHTTDIDDRFLPVLAEDQNDEFVSRRKILP